MAREVKQSHFSVIMKQFLHSLYYLSGGLHIRHHSHVKVFGFVTMPGYSLF